MGSLLKLGFYRKTKEKAIDTLLDINAEERGVLSSTPKDRDRRRRLNTLAVGIAGAASNIIPGVPLQAMAAKALAPKEISTKAAIDATTYSTLGATSALGYLGGAVIKDKGG